MSWRTHLSLFLAALFLANGLESANATVTNDIDGDNDIDLSDFGILKANFGKSALHGDLDLRGDVDGNGKVDMTDFGILKANFGKSASAAADEPPSTTFVDYNEADAPLLSSAGVGILTMGSDIDGDGDLDLSDFGILKANFGKTGAPAPADVIPGDLNGDNKVDMTDFGILKANFGKHPPANAAPEPSTWLLAVLAGLGLAAWRRKKLLA